MFTENNFASGHLPEGRVLRDVVEKGDRPEEGHPSAVSADPKVDGHRVKGDVLALQSCHWSHQQRLCAHLHIEHCKNC